MAVSLAGLFLPSHEASAAIDAVIIRRFEAPEARQGVAVGRKFFYAVDDSTLAKYRRSDGKRIAVWNGDPARFPHINSCAVVGRELVCAASNYPALPMRSSVEVFDPVRLKHLRTIPLGDQPGSLTSVTRRAGAWWASFANYDGKGGTPGRTHLQTVCVKFDDQWRTLGTWRFPAEVLARFRPFSASGSVWGDDGLLYVTGHDAPEIYVLRLPKTGEVLESVGTFSAPIEGQAIAVDPSARDLLWGISRSTRSIIVTRTPKWPE